MESEARIEAAFQTDRVEIAERLVSVYERRLPGPSAQAMLGRARWRTGHLLEAEAMFRRGSVGGSAEGRLGMARTEGSRGRWQQARVLASQATADPAVAARAYRFLAGVEIATGELTAAVDNLAAAAAAESNADRAQRLRDQATALATQDAEGASSAAGVAARGWSGASVEVPLELSEDGVLLVPVEVNGVPARLRLRLDAARSSLASTLAARAGGLAATEEAPGTPPAGEVSVTLRFGDLVAQRQILRVVDDSGAADGTLGFDILGSVRWLLELDRRALTLASTAGPVRGTRFDLPSLKQTHWARARVLRDGLGAQLMVLPRLEGRVVSAQLRATGPTVADRRLFATAAAAVGDSAGTTATPDEPATRELRVGGWRVAQPIGLEDLYPWAEGARVAPQLLLGADVLRVWAVRWSPQKRELTLTELPGGGRPSVGSARPPIQ